MTPETEVRRAICLYIERNGGAILIHDSKGAWHPIRKRFISNVDRFRIKGAADLLGIWKGRPLAIEVKAGKNKASVDQLAFIEWWKKHGGVGFVAWSVEDVAKELGRV